MGYAAVRTGLSEEEYLAFERASPEKHEYADGEIFVMSRCSGEHASVAANIIGELGNALYGRRCRVFTSDMRVRISATGRYVYPDASVVCTRPEYAEDLHDILLNPKVIVEVLSPSTEGYDRGDKFAHYRTVPSLTHYVIASQDKPRIEVFTRQGEGGAWLLQVYGPGEKASLSSLDCAIDVDRVYTNIFDSEESPPIQSSGN